MMLGATRSANHVDGWVNTVDWAPMPYYGASAVPFMWSRSSSTVCAIDGPEAIFRPHLFAGGVIPMQAAGTLHKSDDVIDCGLWYTLLLLWQLVCSSAGMWLRWPQWPTSPFWWTLGGKLCPFRTDDGVVVDDLHCFVNDATRSGLVHRFSKVLKG